MFIGLLSVYTIGSFGQSLVSNSKGLVKLVYLNNQPSKARPIIVNIHFNKTLFYAFTVSVKNCDTNNFIDYPR